MKETLLLSSQRIPTNGGADGSFLKDQTATKQSIEALPTTNRSSKASLNDLTNKKTSRQSINSSQSLLPIIKRLDTSKSPEKSSKPQEKVPPIRLFPHQDQSSNQRSNKNISLRDLFPIAHKTISPKKAVFSRTPFQILLETETSAGDGTQITQTKIDDYQQGISQNSPTSPFLPKLEHEKDEDNNFLKPFGESNRSYTLNNSSSQIDSTKQKRKINPEYFALSNQMYKNQISFLSYPSQTDRATLPSSPRDRSNTNQQIHLLNAQQSYIQLKNKVSTDRKQFCKKKYNFQKNDIQNLSLKDLLKLEKQRELSSKELPDYKVSNTIQESIAELLQPLEFKIDQSEAATTTTTATEQLPLHHRISQKERILKLKEKFKIQEYSNILRSKGLVNPSERLLNPKVQVQQFFMRRDLSDAEKQSAFTKILKSFDQPKSHLTSSTTEIAQMLNTMNPFYQNNYSSSLETPNLQLKTSPQSPDRKSKQSSSQESNSIQKSNIPAQNLQNNNKLSYQFKPALRTTPFKIS